MSHARIRNNTLYQDRTVQDWHYDALGQPCPAIDIDLLGYCEYGYCRETLYLIEATTNPDKHTSVIERLAKLAKVPAYLFLHNRQIVTRVKKIWVPD